MTPSALRLLLITSLTTAPLALATPSLAQDQAAPAVGAGPHHWRDSDRRDPAARAAEHAQRLRDALQLRPDQDAALTAFVQATMPDHEGWAHEGGEHPEGGPGEHKAMTTPERLDRMAAMLDKRRAAFNARAEATKRFYGQLSPSQQKAFDSMEGGLARRGEGGHWGMRHGPGGDKGAPDKPSAG